MVSNLLPLIDECSVVSFDVFDTLVVRLLNSPQNVARYLGDVAQRPDFYTHRREGAKKARQKAQLDSKQNVSLDDIYAEMPEDFALFKNQEEALEIACNIQNPEMKNSYDYALSRCKKIVLVSDMYLPRHAIENILHKNGYDQYDLLLLSEEDNKSKVTGDRFKDIIDRYPEIPAHKILHVGDTYKVDVENAKKHGLSAFYYEKISKHSGNAFVFKRLMDLLKQTPKGFACLMTGSVFAQETLLRTQGERGNSFYWLGFQYTGPILLAFSKWLGQQLSEKSINHVFFEARDGLILKKAFDAVNHDSNIKTHYMCASRKLFGRVLKEPQQSEVFLNYLKSMGFFDAKVAVVDAGHRGVMQKILLKILQEVPDKPEMQGFYFDWHAQDNPLMQGFVGLGAKKYRRFLNFLDFLFIADHPLIVGISKDQDGFVPEYQAKDSAEMRREQVAKEMHQGVLDFLSLASPFYQQFPVSIENDFVFTLGQNLISFSKVDVQSFQGVEIPYGVNNEKSKPVVPPQPSLKKIVFSPLKFLRGQRRAMIKTFFLFRWWDKIR